MAETFHLGHTTPSFSAALSTFALELSSAKAAYVLTKDGEQLAAEPSDAPLPQATATWVAGLDPGSGPPARVFDEAGALATSIALPDGSIGWLVTHMRGATGPARALAFERLVGLSHQSFACFKHPDLAGLRDLLQTSGKLEPKKLASEIRSFVDADLVAIASISGQTVSQVTLSNQPNATTRATHPEQVRRQILKVLRSGLKNSDIHIGTRGDGSVAVKAENPRRNVEFLSSIVNALAAGDVVRDYQRRKIGSAFLKSLGLAAIAAGLAFVPLPDARRIEAEVISTNLRLLTAPISGVVSSVHVADNDPVIANDTLLLEFDASEITQEIAGAQAEYSRALLERETARGALDPAALRNADLEVELLRAKLDLLEVRLDSTRLLAPISGVVVGGNIDTIQGSTIRQGDSLFEVMDLEQLALKLEVPAALLNRLNDDEVGLFRPDFDPSQSLAGQIIHISPTQDAQANSALFEGRASLEGDLGTMRPGLRGVFLFEREFKPLWKIVWEATQNWVLLRVWL
ncbi:MAG: HlyD family efflux transporter periplasmic adaptor subunit [Pseudomonadota bacterium]